MSNLQKFSIKQDKEESQNITNGGKYIIYFALNNRCHSVLLINKIQLILLLHSKFSKQPYNRYLCIFIMFWLSSLSCFMLNFLLGAIARMTIVKPKPGLAWGWCQAKMVPPHSKYNLPRIRSQSRPRRISLWKDHKRALGVLTKPENYLKGRKKKKISPGIHWSSPLQSSSGESQLSFLLFLRK